MIEIKNVSKAFKKKKVLDNVSFVAKPGKVTGFLGPNGAGKTTTMKVLLELIYPDSGEAFVDEARFSQSKTPAKSVGALLDGKLMPKNRTPRTYLISVAKANKLDHTRIPHVLRETGLSHVANKKISTFSLGMCQRLSLSEALLGDPDNLILDEPVNGLDPEGIKWARDLFKKKAEEGKTVLVSSHILSEMENLADEIVIIAKGKIIKTGSLDEVKDGYSSLEDAFISLTGGDAEFKAGF
ncbi:MAG: ATP-binding cassette domain-containing protein [Bifidobacteriaceae bacterium]|jgi:ABC-2 type transport system ATP-binding protein|nr:ATP-binding cassette domain-containing protein [Bifidobacteriaceae bacterium]